MPTATDGQLAASLEVLDLARSMDAVASDPTDLGAIRQIYEGLADDPDFPYKGLAQFGIAGLTERFDPHQALLKYQQLLSSIDEKKQPVPWALTVIKVTALEMMFGVDYEGQPIDGRSLQHRLDKADIICADNWQEGARSAISKLKSGFSGKKGDFVKTVGQLRRSVRQRPANETPTISIGGTGGAQTYAGVGAGVSQN